jgi:hypothetical protein
MTYGFNPLLAQPLINPWSDSRVYKQKSIGAKCIQAYCSHINQNIIHHKKITANIVLGITLSMSAVIFMISSAKNRLLHTRYHNNRFPLLYK